MNPDKTQETNPEQLLKLLEMQVAEARNRRAARESSRGKAGIIGLSIIVGGAALALWMLIVLLGQMRPQHSAQKESTGVAPADAARGQ